MGKSRRDGLPIIRPNKVSCWGTHNLALPQLPMRKSPDPISSHGLPHLRTFLHSVNRDLNFVFAREVEALSSCTSVFVAKYLYVLAVVVHQKGGASADMAALAGMTESKSVIAEKMCNPEGDVFDNDCGVLLLVLPSRRNVKGTWKYDLQPERLRRSRVSRVPPS
jgi:hypothetical protein